MQRGEKSPNLAIVARDDGEGRRGAGDDDDDDDDGDVEGDDEQWDHY